jgi:hypothetical protein
MHLLALNFSLHMVIVCVWIHCIRLLIVSFGLFAPIDVAESAGVRPDYYRWICWCLFSWCYGLLLLARDIWICRYESVDCQLGLVRTDWCVWISWHPDCSGWIYWPVFSWYFELLLVAPNDLCVYIWAKLCFCVIVVEKTRFSKSDLYFYYSGFLLL